jgi:4-hydroxy-4-methyl-2-oxoglutarate aldolase
MSDVAAFDTISPTTLGDILPRAQVMDSGIRPLWAAARLAGPAYPVRCLPGDNLMLHAAIYRAAPGSVLVVQAGDSDFAMAGGNMCAIAQRLGLAGLVVDGAVRDVAEVRELSFPVFARGVIPIPGTKEGVAPLGEPVLCGGVTVHAGDVIVADEEGIAVVPAARQEEVLTEARARQATEAAQTLEEWERSHRSRIDSILREAGFGG